MEQLNAPPTGIHGFSLCYLLVYGNKLYERFDITVFLILQAFSEQPLSSYLLKLYFQSPEESGGSGVVSVQRVSELFHLVHFNNSSGKCI